MIGTLDLDQCPKLVSVRNISHPIGKAATVAVGGKGTGYEKRRRFKTRGEDENRRGGSRVCHRTIFRSFRASRSSSTRRSNAGICPKGGKGLWILPHESCGWRQSKCAGQTIRSEWPFVFQEEVIRLPADSFLIGIGNWRACAVSSLRALIISY
jgi:hypothetical protein